MLCYNDVYLVHNMNYFILISYKMPQLYTGQKKSTEFRCEWAILPPPHNICVWGGAQESHQQQQRSVITTTHCGHKAARASRCSLCPQGTFQENENKIKSLLHYKIQGNFRRAGEKKRHYSPVFSLSFLVLFWRWVGLAVSQRAFSKWLAQVMGSPLNHSSFTPWVQIENMEMAKNQIPRAGSLWMFLFCLALSLVLWISVSGRVFNVTIHIWGSSSLLVSQ